MTIGPTDGVFLSVFAAIGTITVIVLMVAGAYAIYARLRKGDRP